MKISELIVHLTELQREHGDLPVHVWKGYDRYREDLDISDVAVSNKVEYVGEDGSNRLEIG